MTSSPTNIPIKLFLFFELYNTITTIYDVLSADNGSLSVNYVLQRLALTPGQFVNFNNESKTTSSIKYYGNFSSLLQDQIGKDFTWN